MEINLTNHAKQRIKERVGIKSEGKQRALAINAYENGISIEEAEGCIRNMLESREKNEAMVYKMYRDRVFIFADNNLVTILPLDHHFMKNMEKNRCKRKKNNKDAA